MLRLRRRGKTPAFSNNAIHEAYKNDVIRLRLRRRGKTPVFSVSAIHAPQGLKRITKMFSIQTTFLHRDHIYTSCIHGSI